ncbi:MAG: DUF2945 domain-containing protein [Janthinobacterium lividum]
MAQAMKKGDKVKWTAAQGEIEGTVEKTVTSTTKVKGHTAKATKEKPEVLVKSDKSGRQAVHKPNELKKR